VGSSSFLLEDGMDGWFHALGDDALSCFGLLGVCFPSVSFSFGSAVLFFGFILFVCFCETTIFYFDGLLGCMHYVL
jgi:hypothetical protein